MGSRSEVPAMEGEVTDEAVSVLEIDLLELLCRIEIAAAHHIARMARMEARHERHSA